MAKAVPVQPDTLIWARLSLGKTQEQAKDLLGVSLETLKEWEATGHSFSVTQLRAIAAKYQRPVATFLRSTTPTLPGGPEDFRTIGGQEPALSVETLVSIRDAQRIQLIASDLMAVDPTLYPPLALPPADLALDSAGELAVYERQERFGISPGVQFGWQGSNTAYNGWKAAVQFQGVVVLVRKMPREDCRGFSLYSAGLVPVVVVNQKEVDQAKIFTLIHESGHLMLRRQGICLEREDVDKRIVERWCNQFAASVLVPPTLLAAEAPRGHITVNHVRELARRFKVGRPVIALSLIHIGRADESLYAELKLEDESADWTVAAMTSDDDFPLRSQVQIRSSELGFAYPMIVLRALERDLISTLDACDFLDVRAEKLAALRGQAEESMSRYG